MGISNMQNAYKFQRKMLMATGIWPTKNPSLAYKLRGIINYALVLIGTISLGLPCIYLTDFTELIKSWSMFVSLCNCCLKFGFFFYKFPILLKLLDFLHENPHFMYYDDDLDFHLEKAIKISNIVVRLFFSSALSTIISFVASPLVSTRGRELPLPFAIKLYEAPLALYILVYTLQSVSLFLAGWISTGFDNIVIAMMNLSAAYFKILNSTIIKTTDTKILSMTQSSPRKGNVIYYANLDTTINKELCLCVERHLAVIQFTEYIETIFSNVVLMQFLASGAGICLAGFTFANTPVKSYEFAFALSLLITLMFQISLYCAFGNEVTIQSTRIGDACYMTEWIGCGPLVRKTLFLIMERSKRPLVLTAGKFVDLSLNALVTVFKSAMSYGAVLKELYHK